MKKVLLALGVVLVICLSSSCSKQCHCKAVLNGETVSEVDIDRPDDTACSDVANAGFNLSGVLSFETKCTPKLF